HLEDLVPVRRGLAQRRDVRRQRRRPAGNLARSRIWTGPVLDLSRREVLGRRSALAQRPALVIAVKPLLDHPQDAERVARRRHGGRAHRPCVTRWTRLREAIPTGSAVTPRSRPTCRLARRLL